MIWTSIWIGVTTGITCSPGSPRTRWIARMIEAFSPSIPTPRPPISLCNTNHCIGMDCLTLSVGITTPHAWPRASPRPNGWRFSSSCSPCPACPPFITATKSAWSTSRFPRRKAGMPARGRARPCSGIAPSPTMGFPPPRQSPCICQFPAVRASTSSRSYWR